MAWDRFCFLFYFLSTPGSISIHYCSVFISIHYCGHATTNVKRTLLQLHFNLLAVAEPIFFYVVLVSVERCGKTYGTSAARAASEYRAYKDVPYQFLVFQNQCHFIRLPNTNILNLVKAEENI